MRPWIFAASLIVPALLLPAEGIEDRLLEGEILEVSKGDLEKAMAIYKAIHADEKAPEPARARSLLYLARCQRKLGEIEAAKKTLDELVKAHAKEEEVLRQARSFLRELESGKAESPRFDWLREMEKSPEVQAKAFDLVMDLALAPHSEEHRRAMRQLRALGMLSVPVLERVFETSRDAMQRQSIAILLSQMGRYDRVSVLLEPGFLLLNALLQYLQTILIGIPDLGEQARKDLLAAVERAPQGPERDIVRQICLLAGAKENEMAELLRGLEGFVDRWNQFSVREILPRIVERGPAAAKALAARIIDPTCPAPAQAMYFEVLVQKSPGALETPQYVAYIETLEGEPQKASLGKLPEDGKFEILLQLADGPARDAVRNLYWTTGGIAPRGIPRRVRSRIGQIPSQTPSLVPSPDPRWAPVLRAAKDWKGLHFLAEASDAVVEDLVDLLRNRPGLAPEYRGCGNDGGNCQHAGPWDEAGGGPSVAFIEAMIGILDVEDPITLAIALETLSLGKPEAVAPAFPLIERIARGAADDRVREMALHALARVFGTDPEKGSAVARALFDEFRRRASAAETPESYARSPFFEVEAMGSTWWKASSSRRFEDTFEWIFTVMGDAPREALYPQVLALSNATGGAAFEGSFSGRWRSSGDNRVRTRYVSVAAPHLGEVTSPELMVSVTEKLLIGLRALGKRERDGIEAAAGSPADAARIAAFFRRVVAEPAVPLKLRLEVFAWGGEGAFEWLDWKVFLGKDDPLAEEVDDILFRSGWFHARPEPEKNAIIDAALASPQPNIRRAGVERVSLERKDAAEVLKRALDDPGIGVRKKALERLAEITRVDIAPVFHGLLSSPYADVRLGVIAALIRFADPTSIEPLVKLLDDSDVNVRAKALEAVKEIRKTLEEREEWKHWAREGAKPGKEAPKD